MWTKIKEYLTSLGYEQAIVLRDYSYSNAFVGVIQDGKAIYDYEKMVEYLLCEKDCFSTRKEAEDWIEYNVLDVIKKQEDSPIILFPVSWEEVKGD